MASARVPSPSFAVADSVDGVDFDTDTDTFWTTYDSATDSVTMAVVAVVAAVEECGPTDLSPLHDAVDTDALEHLFDAPSERPPTPTSTSFRYEGYEVTVSSEELVQVTPLEET